jgi:FKBP-type peptidyl-prolyl cis-trans isomerase SlyD
MGVSRFLTFHYTLRDPQGRLLDTSRGGDPLSCIEGAGQIIEGLESILRSMQPGDSRKVTVPPERGYGLREEALVQKVARAHLPLGEVKAGDRFQTGPDRHAPVVTVIAVTGDEVTLDANHPMAGLPLHFDVELITARPATPSEQKQAHAVEHG